MKENDVIWVSIEESDKYELSNYGFVRNKYTKKENLLHSDVFNRISKKQSKYKVYQYDKDGNIIKIWDNKEQVYKAGFTSIKSALRQGFNRYFNGYFWFKEDEPFDKNRYAPTKQISVYNRNTNKLLFTGTIGECAKFLGVNLI